MGQAAEAASGVEDVPAGKGGGGDDGFETCELRGAAAPEGGAEIGAMESQGTAVGIQVIIGPKGHSGC